MPQALPRPLVTQSSWGWPVAEVHQGLTAPSLLARSLARNMGVQSQAVGMVQAPGHRMHGAQGSASWLGFRVWGCIGSYHDKEH